MTDYFRPMLFVFFGGAAGTTLRFSVGLAGDALGASSLIAVLAVNIVGAFALGWFTASRAAQSVRLNAFLAAGLLGSFTTFSAYAVEVADLGASDQMALGALYAGGSILLGVAAAVLGRAVAIP
jgi:CrcB protein